MILKVNFKLLRPLVENKKQTKAQIETLLWKQKNTSLQATVLELPFHETHIVDF